MSKILLGAHSLTFVVVAAGVRCTFVVVSSFVVRCSFVVCVVVVCSSLPSFAFVGCWLLVVGC